MVMQRLMKGVLAVVGGVIGLAIIHEIIEDETDDTDGEEGIFYDTLAGTVLTYVVPLLALALLAGAVTLYRFR